MIVGIGNDMVDIRRIERALERFGEKFESRVFGPTERAKANRRKGAGTKVFAGTYAKRFAAKEAFSKAVGTGFSNGVFMRDIEVVNLPSGQPTLRLNGNAKLAAERLVPEGKNLAVQLTLTDEYPYAQAIVLLSAI